MNEQEFIERVREAYAPGPEVGAGLDLTPQPTPSRWWLWLVPVVAVAAALALFWPRATPPAAVDEVPAMVLALETTETDPDLDPLPGEYAVLAEVWDEEMEL